MDMVDDIMVCEERNIEDAGGANPSSGSTSSEKIPDPVVYKLVRVDFDGKLVPATDDELMEVESLLEFDKGEVFSVSDVGDTGGLGSSKDETPEKPRMEEYEGSLQVNTEVVEEISQAHNEKTLPAAASSLNNQQVNRSESTEEPSLQDKFSKRVSFGLNPDFSWLKGEINLDNLTINELQETFKATFGRETSSKDKMWLKRRIAMGLTNSCDVSVTSFVIKEGKFLKKCGELSKNADSEDPMTGEVCSSGDDVPVSCQNHLGDALVSVDVEIRNSLADSGHRSDDGDQGGVKRVRKPTKRYIEELSDNETKDSCEKLSPAKRLVQDKTSKSPVKIAGAIHSGGILTRSDSLGGHGIQVPYVSRIRRCRPRQSLMPLVKFQRANDAMRRTMFEDSVKQESSKLDNFRGDKITEVIISYEEPLASEEKEKGGSTSMSYHSQDREPESCNSLGDSQQDEVTGKCSENKNDVSGNNSEGNAEIEPTAKGTVRRKHHRAWTLTEVVKLVDGVTKFGAGRWSEIKRLSFASQAYRTSVDLKDKWRNLLKASFASPGPVKGSHARKNVSSPIPAPILMKVRELAEINGQAPMIFRASSVNSGSSVNESNRSGYL